MNGDTTSRMVNAYDPPCLSRAADGIFRGCFIGMVWGVFFQPINQSIRAALPPPIASSSDVAGGISSSSTSSASSSSTTVNSKTRKKYIVSNKNMVGDSLTRRLGSMARSSFSFGMFLGTFSGLTCTLEHLRGYKHWSNVLVSGFVAGATLGGPSGNPAFIIGLGAWTGVLTALVDTFGDKR